MLERSGLLSSVEAEHRLAVLVPPYQRATRRLIVRPAAVVETPVAGVAKADLVKVLAVILGDDRTVGTAGPAGFVALSRIVRLAPKTGHRRRRKA